VHRSPKTDVAVAVRDSQTTAWGMLEARTGVIRDSLPSSGPPCFHGAAVDEGMHCGPGRVNKAERMCQRIDFAWARRSGSVAAIPIGRRLTTSMRSFVSFRKPPASLTMDQQLA
jgi:hypothetical protein